MGLLDNLISTICPAYGFVKKAAEENPEAAKKVGKAAGKAVKTAADVAGKTTVGATKTAIATSPIGLTYQAVEYAKQHPQQTKEAAKILGGFGLFGLPGMIYNAIA